MLIDEGFLSPDNEPRQERYSLQHTTIEAITTVLEMPGKMKEFPWPLELQGTGRTFEDEKTILIRYPRGDIFLSFVTIIHELGHLRQEEHNPTLRVKPQMHAALFAQEQDAWTRGWTRFLKSNPDLIQSLNDKFQSYRTKGKFDFTSFQDLYDWVRQNTLHMVEVQRILFEKSGEEAGEPDEKRFDQLADELEKSGIRDFLARFEKARVGEVVDEEEVRGAIKKTVELVIAE